ncbi:cell division septum initiation protein DivIVA [Pseudonocardia sediminis]|uniref:Cell division septum initiation protein DivIVA n=1 Tax=Pseudonocardia sediminis TaxID=1397368 RepID=A0A4Q7UWR9_PSEST|nr:hypothetical protein [Pseudonocardia sediminis]RZT84623.1 cell division septum initiation protein DivIVA [Pseudonocardia sediminis]
MDARDHLSGSDADASSRHSLSRPVAVPDFAPDRDAGAGFAVVLRGYDRAQVDARLAELDRRIGDEIRRADAAESALGAARSHVRRLQDAGTPAPAADERFGARLERVLQAAEREASDLREKAAAEAATVLDGARTEAEQRRRQTEQALLGRAATLDQEFTARAAALDARERDVDERIANAERDADRIRSDAERAAADERAGAERRAADLMRHAEETLREQRADAARDVDRLSGLRDEVRGELSRLRGLLDGELDREPVTTALDEDLFGRTDHDAPGSPGSPDEPGGSTGDLLTGKLRIAPAPDLSDESPNERTAIGSIPPFTVSSIGVLPFRDRSIGAAGNGRSFTTSGDGTAHDPSDDDGVTPAGGVTGTGSGPRTSDDAGSSNGSATRSTSSSRGPR